MSVFTAVRLLPTEQAANEWSATSARTIAHETKEHVFDHVFSSHNNSEVYNSSCRPLVERVVEGYNGTIAAYGQSGAGKTHSLLGTSSEIGLLQLSVSHLLQLINERTSVQYMVKMSAFEIYNEVLVDLLDDENTKRCRLVGDKVVGGIEEIVESNDHFLEICDKAQARRTVGETRMNQKSSRSHAVFQLIVESCQLDHLTRKQSTTVSKLVVLDLAGSENARTMSSANQTAESRKINLSLLALSRVISDLAENPANKCLSFRDSLLTRILKPVLGGNSQFLLLCCIRKAASNETASTISFGLKAKKMPNHAEKNVETGDAALPALLAQIHDLKEQLEQQKKETAGQDKKLLEELLKKVLNSEPEVKKPEFPVSKRRHSIAFGGHFSSLRNVNRQPRLSENSEWSEKLWILEEKEKQAKTVKEEATEHDKMEVDDVLTEKENIKTSDESMKQLMEQLEDLRKRNDANEEALAEEKERSKTLETKLAKTEKELKKWKDAAKTTEEKYSDLKTRGLAMLDGRDTRLKQLEEKLAQKDLELEEKLAQKDLEQKSVEKKLLEEKTKRRKAMQLMDEANHMVKKSLDEERQLRKDAEARRMTESIERKALQEKLDDMTAPSRGFKTVAPAACTVVEHAVLSSRCDMLIRHRDLLIASLNERPCAREDNYSHALPKK